VGEISAADAVGPKVPALLNVHPAPLGDHRVEERVDLVGARDVGRHDQCVRVRFRRLVEGVFSAADERDPEACLEQGPRGRATDSRTCARHDGDACVHV
jgi:hypothetical protein